MEEVGHAVIVLYFNQSAHRAVIVFCFPGLSLKTVFETDKPPKFASQNVYTCIASIQNIRCLVHLDHGIAQSIFNFLTESHFQYKTEELESCLQNFKLADGPPEANALEDYNVDISNLPPSLRYL